MPLFGRRLFLLNEEDTIDNNDQEKVYTIEHTGEKFHSQKLYEKLKKAYELDRWTCECTWRTGLTHKDAYQSEIKTRNSLSTIVPEYFHKTIFDIINHNVKPLDKLAEEISNVLGQGFTIGEPVHFKKRKDTNVVKGVIERIEENDDQRKRTSERTSVQVKLISDKQMKNVKYAVRLSDEDRVINNVQPNELQRSSLIPNREKLKTFIRSYAFRLGNRADSPWVFYDNSVLEKYQVKERLSTAVIEEFKKTTIITLDEIIQEQERILRKQTDEEETQSSQNKKSNQNQSNALVSTQNGHLDDVQIILSDDENRSKSPKKKVKSTPTTPKKSSQSNSSPTKKTSQSNSSSTKKTSQSNSTPTKRSRSPSKQKSPTKTKKQLTLDDMKFTKKSNNNTDNQLLKKSPSTKTTTYTVAVPYSLLQKLDKTRRDRGLDSKVFQRLILHCARTLNDKQRLRLPNEYRSLVQTKFEELELKRRLSEMTEQEKKTFLQKKPKQKSAGPGSREDLDLSTSKVLPLPKQIESVTSMPTHYVGDLLVICTFFTSCHSLFLSTLTDDLSKPSQQFLRSFRHDYLLEAYKTSSTTIFFNYFIEFLQILIRLLFKEDENRLTNDDTNANNEDDSDKQQQQQQQFHFDQNIMDTNHTEQTLIDEDFEQIYDTKLTEIPLTQFTCQELTRLYLLKEKNENYRIIVEKLANSETRDFTISDQIDLLLLLVNTITTNNEIMSDYFEYLTRTMTETYRERNQLLAERRKAQEEEIKQKKLQLQNGENGKVSPKKQNKNGQTLTTKNSIGTANDENNQSSPSTFHDENPESEDDLKSVIQRRRQMVAMSKELKEKREVEAQKVVNEQKRELAIQRAEQAYQEALLNLQFGFRIKPLGYDRHYNRYWFFKGHAGLFVEKGWIGSEISYSTKTSSSQDKSRSSSTATIERLVPIHEPNQWCSYDNEKIIEQLMKSLNDRGIREHDLLANIKKMMPLLQAEFEQIKKEKNPPEEIIVKTETSDDQQQEQQQQQQPQQSNDIIVSFKNDLEDIETRLRLGSLGGFIVNDNLVEWQTKLKQLTERSDLAELLIQLQQTVPDKFASGIFGIYENQSKTSKSSKKKLSALKSSTTNSQNLQIWMNDCRTCKTYSRLYILMMIFENSIAWNKSTVGLKCKICRKKNKDEYIIVCDQCCLGYHLECLRDYTLSDMKSSTNDLWYCPACRPQSTSRRRNQRQEQTKAKIDSYDADIYDMDVDATSNMSSHDNNQDVSDVNSERSNNNNEETNEEYLCCVCAGEASENNDLIKCIQCRSLFHCQCHEPPLRCPPRSTTWMCNSCRNGVNNETNHPSRRIQTRRQVAIRKRGQRTRVQPQRQNGARRTARKNYREIEEDEDDYEYADEEEEEIVDNDNESDYEEETRNQRRSKRIRRLSPESTTDTIDKSDDNYDVRRPATTRRRVRIARSSSSSSSSAVSDEEQILADIRDEDSETEQDEDDEDDYGYEEQEEPIVEQEQQQEPEPEQEQKSEQQTEKYQENGIVETTSPSSQ